MKPSNKPKNGPSATLWPLLVLAASLTGCAQKLEVPSSWPQIPAPPPLTEPLPSGSYSESAARDIQRWRQRLTDMQTTPQHSSPRGPITEPSKPNLKPSPVN